MAKHTNSEMAIEYDGSLCLGGQVVTTSYGIAPDTASREERNANHARIAALWNAAHGMSTEEAVALLNCWADGLRRG